MNIWKIEFENLISRELLLSNETKKLIRNNAPKSLYKYKAVNEYTINSIKNGTMWATSPNNFNDQYDCALFCDDVQVIQRKILDIYNSDLVKENIYIDSILRHVDLKHKTSLIEKELNRIRNELAIICLTEDNDNILMWSYYGNNHRGICIEYDFNLIHNFSEVFPVIYKDEIFDFSKSIANIDPNGIFRKVLNKSSAWEYEN
ncbi:TPA: DUF2971 domain-containing protein [Clostridium perfringens]